MKHFSAFLFIGIVAITGFHANAQINDMNKLSPSKKLKEGDYLFNEGSYYNAIPYYQSLYKRDTANVYVVNQIAQAEYMLRDYNEAEKWFKVLVDLKSIQYPLTLYYYGTMLKYNAKYVQAKQAFKSFIGAYMGENSPQYRKLATSQIQGCDLALKMIANPLKVKITHLDTAVNGPFTEFSPMPIGDSLLLFGSLKSDTVILLNANSKFTQYSQLYLSKRKDTTFSSAILYPGPFNSQDGHTGNGSFSPDGKRFYFTRCNPNQTLQMICNIYASEFRNGKWDEPVKLPEEINLLGSTNTQPTIGYNREGDLIYFVSDRPNGFGGTDIWYALRRKDGTCEPARNLGKKVNTGGDEVTPYYDNDNKILYYSSNGEVGMGGFDIFCSKGAENKFGNPENLGYPINSSDDDMYFTLDKNKTGGYFVSNRPGIISVKGETCCDDIWRFDYIKNIFYVVIGNVYDQDNKKQVIPGATVALLMNNAQIAGASSKPDSLYHWRITPNNAYAVKANKPGWFAGSSDSFYVVKKDKSDTIIANVYLKRISNAAVRISNIYYDFDKATLRPESKTGLDSIYQIMINNPSLILEIGSHTDSKGTHSYNIKLSQSRAQSVVDYLISKNISKDRLVAKGYAETVPIAPNTIDGKDNPEGRQMNRRTEFKVLGTISNTQIIYQQGNPNFNPNENSNPNEIPDFYEIKKDDSDSTSNDKEKQLLTPNDNRQNNEPVNPAHR